MSLSLSVRKITSLIIAGSLLAALAACGANSNDSTSEAASTAPSSSSSGEAAGANAAASDAGTGTSTEPAAAGTQTISYLGKDYTVPARTERLVITGSLEAMEDALVLGVNPVGAISVGGKFPDMFKDITANAESAGEKTQPDFETIVKLKPDVILGTGKFPEEVSAKLAKISTMIPISYSAADWEANLNLLGALTGKQQQAEQIIKQYKDDAAAAKSQLGTKLQDKKVMVVRIRTGNIMIYGADLFFNPSLYQDLGFTVPAEIKAAKSQETVSLEKFSEMNPDYLFIQFSEDENKDKPKALEELENNPIWKTINAVKSNHVYVNAVDPLAQGGTAWSKSTFLKAVVEKLSAE